MSDSYKSLDPSDARRVMTRGIGVGKDYQPFIFIQDLSSSGESVRIRSTTVGRTHHLLSKIELAAFVIFDWCKDSIDLREQYPLPIEDTLAISSQFGIKHPQIRGKLKIVTTDLLIDFRNRGPLALSIKRSEALQDKRTLDKLNIERAYWEHKDVEWRLFTECEISPPLRENLEWLHPLLDQNSTSTFQVNESDVADLGYRLKAYPGTNVTKACAKLDDEYNIPPGSHLTTFRYAVARRLISGPIQKTYHSWMTDDLKHMRGLIEGGAKSAS